MKFTTYNMMFGMYGREPFTNLLGHLSFHGLRSVYLTSFFSRFNKPAVDLVTKTEADLIVLNEVIGNLKKDQIVEELKKKNYTDFCWGPAKHHHAPLDLGTLMASRYEFENVNLTITQKDKMGGGGGGCAVYLPEKNLTVLGVHLGLRNRLSRKQVEQLSDFVENQRNLERRVVLMGDFNMNEKELNQIPAFSHLNLSGVNSTGTSPNVFGLRTFKFDCVDNIFYSQPSSLITSGTFEGYSDHKGVWADLEI